MGNLTVTLLNTAAAQRTFDRALLTIQNNVTNVYTPGWARQRLSIITQPFDPAAGLSGGIRPGILEDSRSRFAETAVRNQQGTLNYDQQLQADLARVEKAFDFNSRNSVPQAITRFFNTFSQLSVNPNDRLARQSVIDQSSTVAQSINGSAHDLALAQSEANSQIREVVDSINSRVAKLQEINVARRQNPGSGNDAGLDAQVYATLEELSQYASVQPILQPDGSVSVYLSGRTALLVGDQQYKIQDDPGNTATTIRNANGDDITGQIQDGKLGALLHERNTLLPGYLADLNTLAKIFADQVNLVQRGGVNPAGVASTADIFAYNSALGEASTLTSTQLTPDDINAALPGAPGGNGNALRLAAVANDKLVNGLSFSEFFGALGAKFGRNLSDARDSTTTGQLLLNQAKTYRDVLSGVNLDESAAELIQFQRAYQASAEMFRVLNQLTETTLNLLR